MNTELKQAAQQALKELGEARKIIRASSSRQLAKDWDRRATDALANLRTAIQQPEPVVPDSSEHLRVIASLGAALRRLSFAAQTTGGTDGPDAELQSAIGQAEKALSLGGIWQAMSATPEPVVDVRCEGCGYMTHHREHMGCVRAAKQHTHPAPSVPGDDFDLICNAIDKADTITMEGDYMLDSDDCIAVVRVMQVLLSVRAAMLAAKKASA